MKQIILIILFLLLSFGTIMSQTTPTFSIPPSTSAYTYSGAMGDVEQLRIYTYIWGRVRKPGLYIVPDDTDLLALISLAGGPTDDAKLSKIRIVRPGLNDEEREVIWINLKKYLNTGDRSNIPVLMPGDTIIVSGTVYYGLNRAASLIATVVSIFNIYFLYLNLIK
ncbi:MAG: SLBB domain-containing protein [Candidatus Cloacimonetes bacterium]|nr:SLBB domain-containing protein [Candidatus Cloacimonadota bacterium]